MECWRLAVRSVFIKTLHCTAFIKRNGRPKYDESTNARPPIARSYQIECIGIAIPLTKNRQNFRNVAEFNIFEWLNLPQKMQENS